MARTKIFRRSSDNSLTNTWNPVLEGYGADVAKTPWLAEYAHNHAIFDNTGSALFESAPGTFFQQPTSLGGYMGQANPATRGVDGSGDKFPSLLPVAIQVAAKTIGFDLVPVIPMDSPVGFLPYLDYLYAGGRTDETGAGFQPYLVKLVNLSSAEKTTVEAETQASPGSFANSGSYAYVGASRVDGNPIIKIIAESTGVLATDLATTFNDNNTFRVELVSALENHISGFTSASDADYANTAATGWTGPYMPANGEVAGSMKREAGEVSKFRQMGLRMFTKFVEAETDQVSISATVEQIQDLNRVWNYDVVSMLENVAVNDLAQSINKRLVDKVFTLADTHNTEIDLVEGTGITTLDLNAGAGGFENVSTLQRRFVTKVLELANLIYHRGRFGAGTFLVTNGRIASALADVAGYSIAQVPTDMAGVAGNLYPAGKVYGVQVYVDPNLSWGDTRVSIGRKGADEEPGVKFMPYIMAESLQTISEGTFSPKIGMKSRYAITEAGWHPETQYVNMEITGDVAVLTGGVAPANFS
jgi:hypothetical protein